MPHFKCLACKTRLYSAARPGDLVGDLCPGCGSLLHREAILAQARLDAERWVDDGGSVNSTVARPLLGMKS